MQSIFLSFLGKGSRKTDDTGNVFFDYDPAVYELGGKKSAKTKFVQAAEIELLGHETFDKVIMITTKESFNAHFNSLENELLGLGVAPEKVFHSLIQEDMDSAGQWAWFEKILQHLEPNDRLVVDLTHGYRAGSIVMTAAIPFLQRAKNISLRGVYYGAFEKNRALSPIIDMKEFFNINEWAEAVSRLVDDADARRLAQVAENSPEEQAKELNDPQLIQALEDLTNTVRNVDVHNVSRKADKALAIIRAKQPGASITGKLLLQTVLDKFSCLSTTELMTGRYDKPYFYTQIEIIKLLNEHKLYMQAFTAMREFVGSIGLIQVKKANMRNEDGRKQRRKAEIFLNMLRYDEASWHFSEQQEKEKERVMPLYNQLKSKRLLNYTAHRQAAIFITAGSTY